MRLIGLVLAVVLAHSLVLVPLAAEAQRQDKIWRIGLIHFGLDHVPPSVVSLREELRALGYEDGRNIRLDFRNELELFSEVVPRPRQLLVLVDPKDPIARRALPELRSAGATRRIHLAEHEASTANGPPAAAVSAGSSERQ